MIIDELFGSLENFKQQLKNKSQLTKRPLKEAFPSQVFINLKSSGYKAHRDGEKRFRGHGNYKVKGGKWS